MHILYLVVGLFACVFVSTTLVQHVGLQRPHSFYHKNERLMWVSLTLSVFVLVVATVLDPSVAHPIPF